MNRFLPAILFFALISESAVAQTFRGAINGTVTDQSSAFVSNAEVKATESTTSVEHSTVTNAEGQFSVPDLPVGVYDISVASSGFATYTADNVRVTAGSIYTLLIKLSISLDVRSLNVSAAALRVDATSATQSDTILEEAVQNIPLNGRDFTQLMAISPGHGGYSINGGGTINGPRNNPVWLRLSVAAQRSKVLPARMEIP